MSWFRCKLQMYLLMRQINWGETPQNYRFADRCNLWIRIRKGYAYIRIFAKENMPWLVSRLATMQDEIKIFGELLTFPTG